MKMTPYLYIMNFLNEIPEPSPFVFCLMLSNQFKGEVLHNNGYFITKIDGRYYGVEGEVFEDELDLVLWSKLDCMSVLNHADSYEAMKWVYIAPYVANDLYAYGVN